MKLDTVANYTSVDSEEVARYTALADMWWDKKGPFWPLHRLNELRVQYIRDEVCRYFQRDPTSARPFQGLKMLDIGCGGGILSEAVTRLGAQVHGSDVVDRNIAVAQHHAKQTGLAIRYETVTAEALASQRNEYDVVLNMEVVEHVADLRGFVNACAQLVRPGGVLIIATINRTWLSWLTAIIGAEYILRWLPKGTHQWRRFPKPAELKELLEKNKLRVFATTGVRVNPVTRRMSLTSFMGVNYMLIATRPEY